MTEAVRAAEDGPGPSPVLTVNEAAAYLRISRSLAFTAVRDGTLPSLRIGRRILVPRRQLEALLDGQPDAHPTGIPEPPRPSRPAQRSS